MLTISRRNVPGNELRQEIEDLCKLRALMMKVENKHRTYNGRPTLKALFKLEVTYSYARNDFHPHFHAILENEEAAQSLRHRWLTFEQNFSKVDVQAQEITPVKGEGAAKEIFKYFTKLLSKDKDTGKIKVYPGTVLDTIFCAMKGRRVYTNYGLKAPPPTDYEAETISDEDIDPNFYNFFLWDQKLADWIEQETGELLTGNKPSDSIQSIFNKQQ
jgi:hypothetical protein